MWLESEATELEAVMETARSMCVAARTAPKARGVDEIQTVVVTGPEKDELANEMERIGKASGQAFFIRDANNVRSAPVVVLIGSRTGSRGTSPCGYCGFGDCAGCDEAGGSCAMAVADLGIALGSAVSVAMDNRVDNRIFFTAGKACLSLRHFGEEIRNVYGIPLSVSGKSIFFDRK